MYCNSPIKPGRKNIFKETFAFIPLPSFLPSLLSFPGVFVTACGLSVVALIWGGRGGRLLFVFFFGAWASPCSGFSGCKHRLQAPNLWAPGLRLQMWYPGLVALRRVGSSWTRDWTHVPCISRQILIHCTTRKV